MRNKEEFFGKVVTYKGTQYKIVSRAGEYVGLETMNGNDRTVITLKELEEIK